MLVQHGGRSGSKSRGTAVKMMIRKALCNLCSNSFILEVNLYHTLSIETLRYMSIHAISRCLCFIKMQHAHGAVLVKRGQ